MTTTSGEDVLRVGQLEVRPSEGLVLVAGHVVPMSMRELGVLGALARRPGRVVTRDDLYRLVWRTHLRPGDRSVDVYVHKVRAKLESALPEWRFIHTHVGFGYRLSPEPFTTLSHGG